MITIPKTLTGRFDHRYHDCRTADRSACPRTRRWKGALLLFLLGGLLTASVPMMAEAQFTLTQITNSTGDSFSTATNGDPSLNADGTRIAFHSDRDLTPGPSGNADGNTEIFLWTSPSTITQITNTTGGGTNEEPSISLDGTRIVFWSNRDLTPGPSSNADGNTEIFLWTSPSTITQITNTTGGRINEGPSISLDGTRIAFVSTHDLTPLNPGNADHNREIFLYTQGVGFTQLTNSTGGNYNLYPTISGDGTRIAFWSNHDLTPGPSGNADGNWEVFLYTQGSGPTQITNTTESDGPTYPPSINSDGTKIAFSFSRNPTGSNNTDLNAEIFLWTQGSGLIQVTDSTVGFNVLPSIDADGTKIAFRSNLDYTGGNPFGTGQIFLWTQGVGFTQVVNSTAGDLSFPSINADGTRIAFTSNSNLTGENADNNHEIFLAGSASVDLQASGAGPGPTLINPVTVTYTLHGCSGKEVYLVVNAPAMGMPWAYLSVTGWLPLPADLATLTPYLSSGPADGTYTLYEDAAPAGAYELYLGCDFVLDGHLNIDTSAGLNVNGVYDYLAVTVSP